MPTTIAALEMDMLYNVFTIVFCARRLNACSLVCAAWNKALNSTVFWKRLSRFQAQLHPADMYTHLLIVLTLGEERLPFLLPRYNSRVSWRIRRPKTWSSWINHFTTEEWWEDLDLQVYALDVHEKLFEISDEDHIFLYRDKWNYLPDSVGLTLQAEIYNNLTEAMYEYCECSNEPTTLNFQISSFNEYIDLTLTDYPLSGAHHRRQGGLAPPSEFWKTITEICSTLNEEQITDYTYDFAHRYTTNPKIKNDHK